MSQYHQFIVAGASTAGKSTFSHELVKKYAIQHIQIDPIIDAFQAVFPQLGITHDALTQETHEASCQAFKPFVSKMIDELDADDFVIEGFRLPLEDLYEKYPHLQYFVFGYPTATPEQKLAECRKFDTVNWTNQMPDDELLATFKFLIEESKRQQAICEKRKIPFFDTTNNYHEQIRRALEQTT